MGVSFALSGGGGLTGSDRLGIVRRLEIATSSELPTAAGTMGAEIGVSWTLADGASGRDWAVGGSALQYPYAPDRVILGFHFEVVRADAVVASDFVAPGRSYDIDGSPSGVNTAHRVHIDALRHFFASFGEGGSGLLLTLRHSTTRAFSAGHTVRVHEIAVGVA